MTFFSLNSFVSGSRWNVWNCNWTRKSSLSPQKFYSLATSTVELNFLWASRKWNFDFLESNLVCIQKFFVQSLFLSLIHKWFEGRCDQANFFWPTRRELLMTHNSQLIAARRAEIFLRDSQLTTQCGPQNFSLTHNSQLIRPCVPKRKIPSLTTHNSQVKPRKTSLETHKKFNSTSNVSLL